MLRVPITQALFCVLLCGSGCMPKESHFTTGHKEMDTVQKFVDESVKKKAVAESDLLRKNLLLAGDLPVALDYTKKHPDFTSYHLLFAIKKYFPGSYAELTNADKAAILSS